jgi:quercetin dioxygenase-like cupin family protein
MRDHHRKRHADRPRSRGLVHRRRLAGRRARGPQPDAAVNRVLFEPGARTHWHTHPEGQILYIVTGTCRAAKEGEPPSRSQAGGVVYFAPDEKHWHGATPDTYMVHMAINIANTTDGGTDWLEPVTEEQYAG